ncbi:hypothetical protein [Novilysobacter antarcticus]|uniref:hypothetical protein n=1 Tax=Novilysobacter antarcticus TaxID=2862543 RepID=UPI001C9A0F15|nr:hypothetical protein [Lysobacter antarcticus]
MKPLAFTFALLFLGGVTSASACFGADYSISEKRAAFVAASKFQDDECEQTLAEFVADLTQDALTWRSLRKHAGTDDFTRSSFDERGAYTAGGRLRDAPSIRFDISVTALQPPDVGNGLIQTVRLAVPTQGSGATCIRMNELIRALGWDTAPQPPIPLHNGGSQYGRIGVVNGTEVRIGSYGHHYPCVDTIALFQMPQADPVDREVPPF